MKYVYPAVFTQEESGYSVRFPDIDGCFTCGDDLSDSLSMANDALSLMLVHLEDEKREIPEPSSIKEIPTREDEFTTLISADTTIYRRTLNNMAVKKTLSIPQWLNQAAMAADLNFSQVLQEALKAKLGLA